MMMMMMDYEKERGDEANKFVLKKFYPFSQ